MIKKIFLTFGAILVLFLGYVALSPSDYTVSREIAINASAEKVFLHLNNQRLTEKWAPWNEVDPDVKMNYSGPDEGVGAKATWDSKGPLGTGSATVVEVVPNEKIVVQLDYSKPAEMHQRAEYTLRTDGEASIVTWKVSGQNNFIGRLMCVFMDMDKVVGGIFEKGLQNLKRTVEGI